MRENEHRDPEIDFLAFLMANEVMDNFGDRNRVEYVAHTILNGEIPLALPSDIESVQHTSVLVQ